MAEAKPFSSKKQIEKSYLEVYVPDPDYHLDVEGKLSHYRRELGLLRDQILRHCDADGVNVVLTTEEVCVFCDEPMYTGVYADGTAGCCDSQLAEQRRGAK